MFSVWFELCLPACQLCVPSGLRCHDRIQTTILSVHILYLCSLPAKHQVVATPEDPDTTVLILSVCAVAWQYTTVSVMVCDVRTSFAITSCIMHTGGQVH